MKKLLLFLSVLWFGLAQASAETYDVDKTDAVDVSPAAWGGTNTYNNYDVTTSDGRATKMVEHYYAQLAQNEELPLKQTVTGLPNGKYTVTLIAKTNCADWDFDVPADFVDGSYDYASVFACPGASYSPAKAVTKAIEADVAKDYARAPQEYTVEATVTDGNLTIGMVLHDMNKTNWHTIQIKSLILHSDVPVTEPVNVTSATGLSVNNATVWKRDNNAGNWQNIPNSGTDNWEQWQGAPGTLNNRIMYRTVQLPAGTYTVKASINALQQNGDDATDKNIDFYVQSGSDIQKVNCYGDFAARELEITLGEAAEVEIGIRAYAAGTANWIAQKNLRLYTTSYSTIEEFEAAYAPLKLAGAYSDLEYAYNSAIDKLDEDGKAHFIELAAAIKAALDGKTYTTEAEINQAIKDVQTYLVQSAYYVEGEDMTSLIKNAAIANGNDWETPRTNSGQQYNGAPDNTYLDFWNNSGNIVKTSQKITVPAGTYALLAATRSSNGEEGKIYAIVGETEFSTPIFKDGAEGGQLGGGWSVTKVKDIVVPEEQEIEIGFYCPTPDSNWAGADDFRLIKTGEATVPGGDDTTDGVIFKWDNVTGADDYVAEAGTIECLGGDKNDRLNYANAALGVNYKTICLNGKKGNLGDGTTNGTYMKVTPTQALKAGDVIAMTAYRNKDAMGKKASAALIFDNGASAVMGADPEFPNLNAAGENPTGAPETIELVVTEEMAGAATFNMTRQDASTNLFITSLIITTTPDEPAADNVEWDPAPGEVDYNAGGKLDQVILTFTDAGMVELNEIPFKANIEDENGNEVDFMYGVNFYFLGMNQACITFNKGVQADGTYTVNVPAGLFTLVMPDGTTKASSELHATYIVTGAGDAPVAGDKMQILPAEGNVTSLQQFTLVINDWDSQFDNYNSQAKFYKNGEFVEDVAFDYDPENWTDPNLYGSLSAPVTEDGTYTLEFPVGSMTTNSWATSNSEPVVYTWTIGEGGGEEELPIGTYAAPIALEDGKTYGLNAAVTGAPNFYTFESDKDVKIILTPTEGSIVEGGFAVSTGNFLMDDQYNDLEGAEMIETMMEPVEGGSEPGIGGDDDELGGDFGWGMAPGRMATTWTAKAGVKYYIMTMGQGAFDVALGEPEEYVGTIDTPINLNETPEWTWGVDGKIPGNATYYTYTAEKDGNLTIFVSNCAENQLNVGEGGWYDSWVHTDGPAYTGEIKTDYNWDAWSETNTFAIEAGTTYFITIFDLYDETIKATFEEATGIKGAAADKANGAIFNVSGQKVDKTAKGILIINGRKVLKK